MSRVVQIRSVFLCYLAMRIGLDSRHKGEHSPAGLPRARMSSIAESMNSSCVSHRAAGVVFIAAMLVYAPCASAHKTSYGYLKADFIGDRSIGQA